jgi:serine/threonine-protein kinase HipA
MGKKIFVYADWSGLQGAISIGLLTAETVRGKEIFAFEYTREWLESPLSQYLDPDLLLFPGREFLRDEKPNFGMFLDSSPDRWGRVLMKRREAIIARKEGRKAENLYESDFLLGVYDGSRMGGLRFKTEENGHFLSFEEGLAAPPWVNLRDLEYASLQLEKDDTYSDEEELKWLNMLISPGSSLGGARPKANVRDKDGNLWIAKFPSNNDELDIGAWEMVVHELAASSGITVAPALLQKYTAKHHTFLIKRFDRINLTKRIHFASAMTLLGYRDGADHHEGVSYLDLAALIRQRCENINENLKELWKRMVFNIMVRNTDDHLRNHGFLLYPDGWGLSPAYDMNAVSAGTGLTLNISENDNSLSLELALEVAQHFRIKPEEASAMIDEMKKSISNWRQIASKYKLSRRELDAMSQAFYAE